MTTPTSIPDTATVAKAEREQVPLSLKVSLADLCAKATALYAHKNYEEAAEVYTQAAEMQREMNGEMDPENADILFLYGRTLFKVGQSKSDVLGGRAPDAKPKPKPKATPKRKPQARSSRSKDGARPPSQIKREMMEAWKADEPSEAPVPATVEASVQESDAAVDSVGSGAVSEVAKTEEADVPNKALFHFEGDENLVGSDEEWEGLHELESGGEGEGREEDEEEDEDDDLAAAYEILDLSRLLFDRKLEALQAETEEGKNDDKDKDGKEDVDPTIRHVKERLADAHDLLAEISLESERYPNAIIDSRASLRYKTELYPEEHEYVAEAHFKLSLALEFGSVTTEQDGEKTVDEGLRDEAVSELKAAINCTKLKLQKKEVELAMLHSPEDNEISRGQIVNVKEMIAEMEQRLVDLEKAPVDIKAALGLQAEVTSTKVPEEVMMAAKDLSGLVRKKRKAEEPGAEGAEGAEDGVSAKKAKDDHVQGGAAIL